MKNLNKLATMVVLTGSLFLNKATAQQSSAPSIGLKGGVNISNLITNEVDDKNALVGFNVGLYTNFPIVDKLSLQPEFNFTTKGSEVTYNNLFDNGTRKFTLSYLEIPVLLKANLTKNFNLHFGPYLSFLVDSKIKQVSSDGSTSFTQLDEDNFNKVDAGLSGGLGFDFENIGIGLRYNYGLTTVGKDQNVNGTTYNALDAKNSNANIYIALKF